MENKTILPRDISKCTSISEKGTNCVMKGNCNRYLSYVSDKYSNGYIPVISAPESIDNNPLDCPLKLTAKEYEI